MGAVYAGLRMKSSVWLQLGVSLFLATAARADSPAVECFDLQALAGLVGSEDAPVFDCPDAVTCVATFPHRADASRAAFARLVDGIRQCPAVLSDRPDAPVNHPDFYTAHVFELPRAALTLSLKDKAALSRTTLTLRRLVQK
jgi:hypothetical protein